MILVCGSKGGVGTTTVAAGLIAKAAVPVVGLDMTGTGDLGRYLGRDMLEAGDLARRGPLGVQEIFRRQRSSVLVVVTEQDRALYPDAPAVIARAAQARRPLVVDAGRSLPPMLIPLVTDVVMVVVPDVRAVRGSEQMLSSLRNARVFVIENMVDDESLFPDAIEVPRAKSSGFQALMRGDMGRALRSLSGELFAPTAAVDEQPQGIVRSAVRRLAGG